MPVTETPRLRDAKRSQETILEAATTLFAKHGFEATTMQQISEAAGVARGTPSYFFTSKEKLFQAVLERESQSAKLVMPNVFGQVGENAKPEAMIATIVDVYLDFLEGHPRYLRLIQWTALERPSLMKEVQSHWQTMLQASEAASLIWKTKNPQDTQQLTLSVIGMCTFHFFFGDVIGQHLGLNTRAKNFLQERKDHLKLLLTAALRGMKSA